MKNKILNKLEALILQYWHWLAFGVMSFLSLSFLILQRGVWMFADSGFYYSNILQTISIATSKLGAFSNTDGFYFGFDNAALSFSHLLVSFYQIILTAVFGSDFGQIVYYFFYYLLIFYFGLKLLAKLFPGSKSLGVRLGALFLAFNPFSLLIITLFTIGYIYATFIIFLYAWLTYLEGGKNRFLLLSALAGIYLLSYLRLIPVIAISLSLFVWLFYDKRYFNWKRILVSLTIFILCASPFIVGNILSISSSNVVSNYKDSFSRFEEANYDFKSSFINSFSHPGGFTPSSLSYFYNNRGLPDFADNFAVDNTFEFYKTIQIIFNIGLLILSLYFFKSKQNLKIITLILGVFMINTLGFFVSFNFFNKVNNSLIVFLYNDYGFIQFIQSILYSFLIVSLVTSFSKSPKHKNRLPLFFFLIVFYLLLNMVPFFSGHYGLKKINLANIPSDYRYEIFTEEKYDFNEATIFAPYHWLKFKWSPYYLDLNFAPYSKYKSLIVPNLRLIDEEFIDFYNRIYENFNQANLSNISIFNIKNIILFRDVEDANKNIDTYRVINLENNSKKMDLELARRFDTTIVSNNDNFVHYKLPQADNYDFLLYSPKEIVNVDLETFYTRKLNLEDKPVLFNKGILSKVNLIKDINYKLNSPFLDIKTSPLNSNKYYVKAYVDKSNPFLLQLNQSYSYFWKVYFISKEEFDSVECQSDWQEYAVSENKKCNYGKTSFDLTDFDLINNKYLKAENHYQGNLIGNGFVITPNDIPEEFRQGDELYMVVYFEKQLYYLLTLTISALTFILLIILSVIDVLIEKSKRYEK